MKAPDHFESMIKPLLPRVKRITYEALLNVFEHAYDKETPKLVWITASILSARDQIDLYSCDEEHEVENSVHSPKEVGWIEAMDGSHVLEIAICDNGKGIPSSLQDDARQKSPELANALKSLGSGTNKFHDLRAELHSSLCDYAFRHDSSRKGDEEFDPPVLKLNSRGLYRCYRQVLDVGGAIAVASGRGRAGYVSKSFRSIRFKFAIQLKGDLPGTLWSVRLPLPAQEAPLPPRPQGHIHEPQLRWKHIVPWDESSARLVVLSGVQKIDVSKESDITAVVMPYVEIVTDTVGQLSHQIGVGQLINFLHNKLSYRVPVICFAKPSEKWRQHVRVIAPDEPEIRGKMGDPRLLGWMSSDGKVEWAIAGVILEPNQDFVERLETSGLAVAETPEEKSLASDLVAHQPNHLVWNEHTSTLTLPLHNARVEISDHQRAFQSAWKVYWKSDDVRKNVVTEKEGCAILLATGTRVRRHFSVFWLLQQSVLLAEALGAVFARILRQKLEMTEHLVVVVDQPASKYICHALFVINGTVRPEIFTLEEVLRVTSKPAKVVLFTDAILQGNTSRRVVEKLFSMGIKVECIVTCADLRSSDVKSEFWKAQVRSLIDVSDVHLEIIPNGAEGLRDIEIDTITHVPIDQEPSPFIHLAWNGEIRDFLQENSHLFSVGYQRLSERTHVVTLPIGRVFQSPAHVTLIVNWVTQEVSRCINLMTFNPDGRSIAIFSRYDSKIGELENALVKELTSTFKGHDGIFFVKLPAAYRDTHPFFPHHGFDLFAECKDKTGVEFSNQGHKPRNGYIGIYLDDATVTGNSIRDFLNRAMEHAELRPSGIVALAVVNRLSPGEVRFFELCKDLQSTGHEAKTPFIYRSIFNLQVRSQRHQLLAGHPLLDEIVGSELFHHPDLEPYVRSLRTQYRAPQSKVPWCHLFAPDEKSALVSTGAVRFRHLLALNQQNEPVVVEIVNLLQLLTEPKVSDSSLLTIFAIEPMLLLAPTLRQFGREIIIQLAIKTINGSISLARKSDALAVLATYPDAFIERFAEFAPPVLEDKSMRAQLAVHLIANVSQRPETEFPPELGRLNSQASEGLTWLRRMLAVAKGVHELTHRHHNESTSQHAIFILGSHLAAHSPTDNADDNWRHTWIRLDMLVQRWESLNSQPRRKSILAACFKQVEFAKRVLLPAFTALIRYLEIEADPEGVEELRAAQSVAFDRLIDFEDELNNQGSEFDLPGARLIHAKLEKLRKATWLTPIPSDRILSGYGLIDESGPIAKWFPRAFCAPSALLVSIGENMFDTASPFTEFQEVGPTKHWITIAPVPTNILEQILRLLFQNVDIHGDVSSLRVAHIRSTDHDWTVRIANRPNARKRSGSTNGSGRGLQVARDYADRYGMVLKIEEPSNQTHEWIALLTIPKTFKLDQMIPTL